MISLADEIAQSWHGLADHHQNIHRTAAVVFENHSDVLNSIMKSVEQAVRKEVIDATKSHTACILSILESAQVDASKLDLEDKIKF